MEKVFLNVQTTGLEETDQIIDIAVVNTEGDVIFSSYCKPTVPINPEAFNVHGITDDMLNNAPVWPDIADKLKAVLNNKVVVGYPSHFVYEMLNQTAATNDNNFDTCNIKFYCCAQLVNKSFYNDDYNRNYFPYLEYLLSDSEIDTLDSNRVAINKAVATALVYKKTIKINEAKAKAKAKARAWREKASNVRYALIPDNYKDYPYFGQSNRPDGYITLSKLPLKDTDKFEYAGVCCDSYGNKGHLFKPK